MSVVALVHRLVLADMIPQSTMHDDSTRVAPMCGMAAFDGT